MRSTAAKLGLSEDALFEPLPELSPQALTAMRCWNFCEGWRPERWPLFGAFHDVADWAAVVELMQAMKDAPA